MAKTVSTKIRNSDFDFENSPIRVLANRNLKEIQLPGLTVGPLEEGNEYDVEYWIARQLVRSGVARFRDEEMLDASKLYKIQWKERVQRVKQVSKLPDNFYPKLRRCLEEMREKMNEKKEKMQEYEKMKQAAQDIIVSRLKKTVSLASAPAQTQQFLGSLTSEEKFLYEEINKLVSEWRSEILKNEEEQK